MVKSSIVVEEISKKFGLSLKSALRYGLADSFRRLAGKGKNPSLRDGEFWALDNVNFSLEPGDALGIMGVNGSGKTTLLRILNGTYSPDKGRVTMRGRVGALIAAGAGFSPMLTGRENVFISGTLLGMSPKEIKKRFDEIVAFAELDKFIDMPVRNYSSGMAVRLGFAVAVLGSPDILLVDEVLAVGDLNFQKKCYERIQTLKQDGTTIILVSHSTGAIWSVCNKGLVLHHGVSEGIGTVEDACRKYDDYNMAERLGNGPSDGNHEELPKDYSGAKGGTGDVVVRNVSIRSIDGQDSDSIGFGEPFLIRGSIAVRRPINNGIFRVALDSELYKGIAIIDSYETTGEVYHFPPGIHDVEILVKDNNFRPGVYSLGVAVVEKNVGVHLFFEMNAARFMIKNPDDKFLYADFRSVAHVESQFRFSIQA